MENILQSFLSVYGEVGFVYTKVSSYLPGRTLSPDGVDRYLSTGIGINYESRNSADFPTKGTLLHLDYLHFGFINKYVDFGRSNLIENYYLPFKVKNDYSVILVQKTNASVALGPNVPYYSRNFIGYNGNIIRGWYRFGLEGDNSLVLNNEIKFPIISQKSIPGTQVPIVKNIGLLNKYNYPYGLYFTTFYDLGTVWNKNERIKNIHFLSGAGIGINAILPFGLIAIIDWAVELGQPYKGQIIFSFGGDL